MVDISTTFRLLNVVRSKSGGLIKYYVLLYRHGCFTEKYTTRKIHKKYIRDPSGLFSIISHVSLSMISLISSLSLKLYLNSLVYHRNIFGSSSKVFGNLRASSENFGNSRKMFGSVRLAFGTIWWSEIFGKSSKTPSSTCLYNKKNITRRLEDMNFIFSWQKTIFYSLAALVRKILFCHSKIEFISSRPRLISSIYLLSVCLNLAFFVACVTAASPRKKNRGETAVTQATFFDE